MRKKVIYGLFLVPLFVFTTGCSSQEPIIDSTPDTENVTDAPQTESKEITRDDIDEKYKWDLTELYASEEEWQVSKDALEKRIDEFEKYKGKLGQSSDMLYNCLELYSDISKEYSRLSGYAYQLSDEDNRKSGPQALRQEIEQIGVKISSANSFIEPEILALDTAKVKKFIDQNDKLKTYAHYIDNIQRLKPHTLSAEEEAIVSQADLMSGIAPDDYFIFKDADMIRPTITTDDGKVVTLDDANYTLYRADSNREFRKQVFEKFFGEYKKYERTFGTELYGEVKTDMFYKNVRKYDSSLETALNRNNIPVSVYENLITSVHENLPTLHRYLLLRKKMLGLDELHYYDLYPSMVKDIDESYTIDEAEGLVTKALAPLGNDYVSTVQHAFDNRWVDVYSTTGKSSGAYSSGGAYDVHPYVLLNFMGKYDDMSTLAHELGHTMHSYYSNKNQAYINSHYPTFLAEVASVTNEALLSDYILKNTQDPQLRLSILGNLLEQYRTTLFRQTQFAEFELKIHEMAEAGEALTGEKLSEIYLDILKTYYGDKEGITKIDDLYGIEWAYIPHFYYNFYVFQYSTSMCASTAVSEKIINDEDNIREKYVSDFLSAGSSDYAIPILKRLGVDMTTTEPCEMTFKKMNDIMDEMEEILNANK